MSLSLTRIALRLSSAVTRISPPLAVVRRKSKPQSRRFFTTLKNFSKFFFESKKAPANKPFLLEKLICQGWRSLPAARSRFAAVTDPYPVRYTPRLIDVARLPFPDDCYSVFNMECGTPLSNTARLPNVSVP